MSAKVIGANAQQFDIYAKIELVHNNLESLVEFLQDEESSIIRGSTRLTNCQLQNDLFSNIQQTTEEVRHSLKAVCPVVQKKLKIDLSELERKIQAVGLRLLLLPTLLDIRDKIFFLQASFNDSQHDTLTPVQRISQQKQAEELLSNFPHMPKELWQTLVKTYEKINQIVLKNTFSTDHKASIALITLKNKIEELNGSPTYENRMVFVSLLKQSTRSDRTQIYEYVANANQVSSWFKRAKGKRMIWDNLDIVKNCISELDTVKRCLPHLQALHTPID